MPFQKLMELVEELGPDNPGYPQLWHFTCLHGRHGIGLRGDVRAPAVHPILKARIAWFTELAEPDREASGLGMHHTRCDRMSYRYRVVAPWACERWLDSKAAARSARVVCR